MKIFFKWVIRAVLVSLLFAGIYVAQAVWFRPLSIDIFYNKIFLQFMLKQPEMLSSMRLLEPFGITGHNGKLNNASPEFAQEMIAFSQNNLAQLHAYDRTSLSDDEQLSYDVLDYFLTDQVKSAEYQHHNYPVNQLFGVQNNFPSFLASKHQIKSLEDAEYYLDRLIAVEVKFNQVLEGLKIRTQKNIIPPAFVVEKVLKEMRDFVAQPATKNILFTNFSKKIQKLDSLESQQKKQLQTQVEAQINNHVYPAYQQLIAYFEEIQPKATENHGVWALPDGDAYYARQVQHHTTTDLTPAQIHQTGLDEVLRIESKMDQILSAEGYTEGGIGERMRLIAHETRFLYADNDASREQILRDYQAIIDDIDQSLDSYFDIRPKTGVEVKRIPKFKEKTAPGAYYNAPALDGSRPGMFFANLRDVKDIPRYGMNTLAYHEAIPGHHFQLAIALELQDLPMFRRMLPFTAYAEGWALYAERLAWELGKAEDPYINLGRLQAEMFRAVRLVVDTGLHYKRWTREQAIDYMAEKTGMAQTDVVAEIERYLVAPGQALAYKIGMLKILALREQAKAELGDKFDIKTFHNTILSQSALPLDLLEQQVTRYISRSL